MNSNREYVKRKHSVRFDEKRESDFKSWWKEVDPTHRKYKTESAALRAYLDHKDETIEKMEERLSQRQTAPAVEKEIVDKALGLDYPTDCYDMLPIEGKPNLRQCICPTLKRPVPVPLINGKYIVDNPRICRRCKALGYRKVKEKRKIKHAVYNPKKAYKNSERREYSERKSSIDMGSSESYSLIDNA